MSERASCRSFDDSVPWWLCVIWVCRVCSVLFVGCVVSRVLCVVCWPFLAMIRTYELMYVVREWITLLSGCRCCSMGFCHYDIENAYVRHYKLSQ